MTEYESYIEIESQSTPGVRLRLKKMSFGRRLELAREIRGLANRIEFLRAGNDAVEQMTAALLAREVDLIYLRWGVAGVEGLRVDGEAVTVDRLVEDGPEELAREAIRAVRARCGLNEEERKN